MATFGTAEPHLGAHAAKRNSRAQFRVGKTGMRGKNGGVLAACGHAGRAQRRVHVSRPAVAHSNGREQLFQAICSDQNALLCVPCGVAKCVVLHDSVAVQLVQCGTGHGCCVGVWRLVLTVWFE